MIDITTHRIYGSKCPCCGKTLDAATGIGGRSPSPGDFTICIYCKTWLIFTDDLAQREVTAEDLTRLSPDQLALMKHLTENMPTA